MSTRKKQKGNYTFFIACEGSVSEKEYFEAIRDDVNLKWGVWIDIYPPDAESPNDPVNLVKTAQNEIGAYTEVWAVFDKNGHSGLKDAFKIANQNLDGDSVDVAFSSISFEHWVLLHFEKNKTKFKKSDCKDKKNKKKYILCGKLDNTHTGNCKGTICVAGRLRSENYIPNYEKKGDYPLYSSLKEHDGSALENSSWLRYQMEATEDANKHYTLNPYTNFDKLYKKLHNVKEDIFWSEIGHVFEHSGIKIIAEYNYPDVSFIIENIAPTTVIIMLSKKLEHFFYLTNEKGEVYNDLELESVSIVSDNNSGASKKTEHSIVLFPSDKVEIKFKASILSTPVYLNFKHENIRLMFEID